MLPFTMQVGRRIGDDPDSGAMSRIEGTCAVGAVWTRGRPLHNLVVTPLCAAVKSSENCGSDSFPINLTIK